MIEFLLFIGGVVVLLIALLHNLSKGCCS